MTEIPLMKEFGIACVQDFLGDFVVYRNLIPFDPRLADAVSRRSTGTPRKLDREYAVEMAALLREARSLELVHGQLHRLIYLGDTRLSDGTAFQNLCGVGEWPGAAFIADEKTEDPEIFHGEDLGEAMLYSANRWGALERFEAELKAHGFEVDEHTAVIIDLDKTAFGARGRNDHVIDLVRKQAVQRTIAELVGENFNNTNFQQAYDRLNQPIFHPLTEDNQDYLAYICLILESEVWDLPRLVESFNQGELNNFKEFLGEVQHHIQKLPTPLREIHKDVMSALEAGDPTPFKSFRRMEYFLTVERMHPSEGAKSIEAVLLEEIVLTAEVFRIAKEWAEAGALLFGLSDKPDEASIPTPEQREEGLVPIHQTKMRIVGAGS